MSETISKNGPYRCRRRDAFRTKITGSLRVWLANDLA